jgi:hypothetical protein
VSRLPFLVGLPMALCLAWSAAEAPLAGQTSPIQGVLRGRVHAGAEGAPIADALITITRGGAPQAEGAVAAGPVMRARTDVGGRFAVPVDAGTYTVRAEAFGYEAGERSGLVVRNGQTTDFILRLEIAPFRLEEIVVAPSTYGLLRRHVVSGQLITREELEVRPHWGNDVFRTLAQVPGITTNDYTAMPFVRGGRPAEVSTFLDGLELYEPYHLKQWDGSLSIVDMETVADVDLSTGAFPAEYGDASTGVFAMRTTTAAPGPARTSVGLDFLSSAVKSEGSFAQGKGAWIVSARRGFLDLILELTGRNDEEDLHPWYYDVFSKAQYEVAPGHVLSAHLLRAGDDNRGTENDSTVYRHRYGSSYGWVTWDARVTPRTTARTVVSVGRLMRNRSGADFPEPGAAPDVDVRDRAGFEFFGLRQDWLLRLADRAMVKVGFNGTWGSADYDYRRWRQYWMPNATDVSMPDFVRQYDTLNIVTTKTGIETAAYLSGRVQPTERLTVEAGLRYDRQHHTGAESWGESQLAPRLNAAYQVGSRTTVRAAWGHYYQSQGLHQLWVSDGDLAFYPAQRAEHRVLGVEHNTSRGIALRVEAYQRLLRDPLPEYRNLENDIEALREEGPEDRIFVHPDRGRARGLELFAKGGETTSLTWAVGYALSVAEELIHGRWVPLPFDQRHALNVQIGLRPAPSWSISLGWTYHSAWPFTTIEYGLDTTVSGYPYIVSGYGLLNDQRLIDYSRVDFRVAKEFPVTRGNLLLYLDVFNLLNRENAQAASHYAGVYEGRLVLDRGIDPQLEVMPSVGLRWTF